MLFRNRRQEALKKEPFVIRRLELPHNNDWTMQAFQSIESAMAAIAAEDARDSQPGSRTSLAPIIAKDTKQLVQPPEWSVRRNTTSLMTNNAQDTGSLSLQNLPTTQWLQRSLIHEESKTDPAQSKHNTMTALEGLLADLGLLIATHRPAEYKGKAVEYLATASRQSHRVAHSNEDALDSTMSPDLDDNSAESIQVAFTDRDHATHEQSLSKGKGRHEVSIVPTREEVEALDFGELSYMPEEQHVQGKQRADDVRESSALSPVNSFSTKSALRQPDKCTDTGALGYVIKRDLAQREELNHASHVPHPGSRAQVVPQTTAVEEMSLSSSARFCSICAYFLPADEFPVELPTSKCAHPDSACTPCLQMWISTQLKEHGCESIRCPVCRHTFSYAEVRVASTPETFALYDDLCTRRALDSMKEFTWCLRAGCKSGQLHAGGPNAAYMQCLDCGFRQCLQHRCSWHDGKTCAQYDYSHRGTMTRKEKKREEKSAKYMTKHTIKCPGRTCGASIQKTDGCDHMTCSKCKTEFCYLCRALYNHIRTEGNAAHDPVCKYHPNNL